jgi:tellurite resistance protein TehA-like permease
MVVFYSKNKQETEYENVWNLFFAEILISNNHTQLKTNSESNEIQI